NWMPPPEAPTTLRRMMFPTILTDPAAPADMPPPDRQSVPTLSSMTFPTIWAPQDESGHGLAEISMPTPLPPEVPGILLFRAITLRCTRDAVWSTRTAEH